VREFATFHGCLVELEDLMKTYGKPLPFSYPEFKETLTRCDELIKPYATELVDKRNSSVKKAVRTLLFIGKEKEIDGLRKQISAHCQALQMCLSFIHLLVSPFCTVSLPIAAHSTQETAARNHDPESAPIGFGFLPPHEY
jgi:hypothetical protein